jgi:hypothetical protein
VIELITVDIIRKNAVAIMAAEKGKQKTQHIAAD